MAQYIDKDALLARIKKLKMDIGNIFNEYDDGFWEGRTTAFDDVICALDTIKVKEVDLEKEIDKFYGMYRKNGKTYLIEDNEECVDWKVDCNPNFEKAFAKHFYELGMAASNKAQKREEV